MENKKHAELYINMFLLVMKLEATWLEEMEEIKTR